MAAELGKAYVQVVASAEGIGGQIEDILSPEADRAGKSAGKSIGAQIGSFARKTVAALGVGKMVSDSIVNGMNFETSMAKASTLFSGTSEELAGLQDEILRISNTTGVSASQLAEAAYSAESASVPMGNLGSMIESSSKLATAGFTDIDTALSATAKTMNAYGMVSDDVAATQANMEEVQRILIQTQNKGITTVGELGASLAQVTPTAAAAGVGFDQVGAALAMMTAQGTPTAQATTQLRSAIAELSKSGTKANVALMEAAGGTKYAGMSFTEMMDAGADLGDIFGMLQDHADYCGVSMLDLWSSIEGGNAALAIAKDVGTFDADLAAMSTDADVVGDAYGKMADTVAHKMEVIKTTLTNMGIGAFNGLADILVNVLGGLSQVLTNISPVLGVVKDSFMGLFTGIAEHMGHTVGLGENFSLIDAISAALTTTLTALSTAVQFLTDHLDVILPVATGVLSALASYKVITKVQKLLTKIPTLAALLTKLKVAFAAISAPVMIAVAAIGAIVAAFLYLWNTNEGFRNAITETFNSIVEAAKGFVEGVQQRLEDLGIDFEAVSETVRKIWDGLCNFLAPVLSAAFKAISTNLKSVFRIILGVLDVFIGVFTGDWDKTWNGVKEIFSGIWDAISGVWNTIKETALEVWDGIKAAVTEPIDAAKESIGNTWDSIKEKAEGAWSNIKNAITGPIEEAKNTIDTTLDKIKGFFPLSIGKIFSNLKIPKITVSGGEAPFGIAGRGKLPSFDVEWNAKAMNQPYMFSDATFFGAGEAGDEFLYGRRALLSDIREATGGRPVTITNYITVDGAEDPEEFAERFVRSMKLRMRTV